ncbi:MAG: tyrosine-type recombinase/integrase [Cellulomonadaceae bacterium]|nr:tyrosine-type recombinase/integrase [Cellulomonadaceae bacterium]
MTELTIPDAPHGDLAYLHPDDVAAVAAAVAAARAPSTRRVYASAWRGWERWCAERGYANMPANPVHVASHVAWLGSVGRSVSTIDRAIAAIAAEHQSRGLDDPTTAAGVRLTRAGVRRMVGAAPRRQAHPITTEEVRRLVEVGDPSSLRGLRDRALILVGYAAALRRSEVGAIARRDVAYRSQGIALTLARSKADQEGVGVVVGIARGHGITDPVAAVRAWVAAAGIDDPAEPIFVRIAWSDRRALRGHPLSGEAVQAVLLTRAREAGIDDLDLTGHSLRAGHATIAAEAGVPADRLARTTRHARLETLARYVRPHSALRDTSSASLGL